MSAWCMNPCFPWVFPLVSPLLLDAMVERFGHIAHGHKSDGEQCMFLEAVQYDYNNGVLTYGDFADEVGDDGELNSIGLWYKPWYM